jgi:GNAT superfamily N-acetyltransferase
MPTRWHNEATQSRDYIPFLGELKCCGAMAKSNKSKAEAPAYFDGCFPKHVEIHFDRELAMMWSSRIKDHRRVRADRCVMEVTYVPLAQKVRVKSKLDRIVKGDGEEWNAVDFNFVAYLWEQSKRGTPNAFLTFEVNADERTRSDRLDFVTFNVDLAYVRKASRRRGLGSFLAAAFEEWLSRCRVYGDRVKRGGVTVTFYADFYSEGGGNIGEILHAHFVVMQDIKGDTPMRSIGWDIKDLHFDAGF